MLSPSASLTDVDDTELGFASVQITAGSFPGDGDTLTVNGATSGTVTGITFLWDPTLHALVLTGVSSPANYQALLQAVTFQSTNHNPTNFGTNPQRTLTWFVSDGTAVTTATTTLDIVAHDDPAVAQPDAVATTENTVILGRAVAGNLFANNGFGPDGDPDGGAFVVTAVSVGTVGTPISLPSGALLIVNANGTFDYDPNHVFDYLPAPGSGASNLTVNDTFSYAITGGDAAIVRVTVSGVDSNDVLIDSAGIDNLAGGILNDVYYVSNTGDVVSLLRQHGRRGRRGCQRRFRHRGRVRRLHAAGQQHGRGSQYDGLGIDRYGLGRRRNVHQQQRKHAGRSRRQ